MDDNRMQLFEDKRIRLERKLNVVDVVSVLTDQATLEVQAPIGQF